MKKIIHFALFLFCALACNQVNAVPESQTVIAPSGDGVSVWNKNGIIEASILTGGTWGTPAQISNPSVQAMWPKAVTSSSGAIAVIWAEFNASGDWVLGGATYDFSTPAWNAPQVLSGISETLTTPEDHFITISPTDEIVISYISTDPSTFVQTLIGIFSPSYGTWGTPVTIIP